MSTVDPGPNHGDNKCAVDVERVASSFHGTLSKSSPLRVTPLHDDSPLERGVGGRP